MKLYFHQETGNVYQLHQDEVWAHPIYEGDQLLDLDTDADMEWTELSPYGDDLMHEGKELTQWDFEKIIRAKLASHLASFMRK